MTSFYCLRCCRDISRLRLHNDIAFYFNYRSTICMNRIVMTSGMWNGRKNMQCLNRARRKELTIGPFAENERNEIPRKVNAKIY